MVNYINRYLLGSLILISVFIMVHLETYHVILVFLFLGGVVILYSNPTDEKSNAAWFERLSSITWTLVGILTAILIGENLEPLIKEIFGNVFFLLLVCFGVFLNYIKMTYLKG